MSYYFYLCNNNNIQETIKIRNTVKYSARGYEGHADEYIKNLIYILMKIYSSVYGYDIFGAVLIYGMRS